MSDISLELQKRTIEGKKVANLRRDEIVPSVVYGASMEATSTQSALGVTTRVVAAAGRHTPVNLKIDGKKKLAIIKTIDIDPVKHRVRHIAFQAIKQNEKIVTEVPIILKGEGESAAERAGLVVLQAIEMIEVRAIPANLPESIELDITGLATTDDKLTVADIVLGDGVEFADMDQHTDLVIANVYEPSALQAANDAAGGDAEDESAVESENGSDSDQESQAEEDKPGGKNQDEPKQSNVDANK